MTRLIGAVQLAALAGITPDALRMARKRGRLRGVLVSPRVWLYEPREVARFLKRKRR